METDRILRLSIGAMAGQRYSARPPRAMPQSTRRTKASPEAAGREKNVSRDHLNKVDAFHDEFRHLRADEQRSDPAEKHPGPGVHFLA